MRYINKIGVEIEADCIPKNRDDWETGINGFNLTSDGSISRTHSDSYALEYVSKPFNDVSELKKAIRELYEKEIVGVNESEGLHFHISLKHKWFFCLCSLKFQRHFKKCLKESQLYKDNELLQKRFKNTRWAKWRSNTENHAIDRELRDNEGDRYHAINYLSYHKHGTLEFRIFPAMETAKEVNAAMDIVLKAVNSYLWGKKYEKLAKRTVKIETGKEETETISKEILYNWTVV